MKQESDEEYMLRVGSWSRPSRAYWNVSFVRAGQRDGKTTSDKETAEKFYEMLKADPLCSRAELTKQEVKVTAVAFFEHTEPRTE